MKKLTASEEKVRQILWDLKKAFVKDIIDQLPLPRPPYNTISSVVRILEKKGFISYKAYGKTHEYFPLRKETFFTFNRFILIAAVFLY